MTFKTRRRIKSTSYAWARMWSSIATASLLLFAACGAHAGFWDPAFRNGALRTEYAPGQGAAGNALTLDFGRVGTDYGCLWNTDDPLASFFKCAGRRNDDPDVWSGNLQARSACGGDATPVGDSWRGCISYREDTYFGLNAPHDLYWVVHANNDPAFDQCRRGPPSASETIVDPVAAPARPSLYKIGFDVQSGGSRILNIIVAPWEHDFACAGYVDPWTGGNKQMTIPYLSVGAHADRGNGEPVAYVHPSLRTGADVLRFDARIRGHSALACRGDPDDPCRPEHVAAHAGVLFIARWAGVRRMLFFDLYNEGVLANAAPSSSHWSWPIQESMFWPGGEVAAMSAEQVTSGCAATSAVPRLEPGAGDTTHYALNVTKLLSCAETLGLWTDPMPDTVLEVEAIDWFVETSGTTGMLWLAIENPEIAGE